MLDMWIELTVDFFVYLLIGLIHLTIAAVLLLPVIIPLRLISAVKHPEREELLPQWKSFNSTEEMKYSLPFHLSLPLS